MRDTLPPLWDRRGIPQEGDPCCGLEDAGERQKGKWGLFLKGGTDGYQMPLAQGGYQGADLERLADVPTRCAHVKGFGVRQPWV